MLIYKVNVIMEIYAKFSLVNLLELFLSGPTIGKIGFYTENQTCQEASKNTGFFGSFSQMSDPRLPIWEASVQHKFKGLFCVLGPKEDFWFYKNVHFLSVF